MYSLYRAWLSLGPCSGLTPLPPSLPSPTPLNLSAPTQLPGTPDVSLQVGPSMTQFSAHRTVLSAHSGFFKAALANHSAGISLPIMVPNVNVDEFSSLLTFMYTGYLDLNISNIYNILLATHILHMPRALEICRSFLLQTQSQSTQPTHSNVIKPIASRKTMLPMQPIHAPITFHNNLQKSEDTVFKTVEKPPIDAALSKASTSRIAPMEIETATSSTTLTNQEKLDRKNEAKLRLQKLKPTLIHTTSSNNSNEKVIIDIACCDGPVRFHRVINKNYGKTPPAAQTIENYEVNEINRNAVLNKVMNENIRDKLGDEENENSTQNEVFTCLYCNHTFKSQYCYQKHARRHLNPVSLEAKTVQQTKEIKREVKLLDMNVQYYPCKSCGSKFPSYYFVHKHRKMCHAEEMADNNHKNNVMVPENVNDSTNSSAIDVEAINTNDSSIN